MTLSYFRNYFTSEAEFNAFKLSNSSLVNQANTLYNSLINYGHSEFVAKQVVAQELYDSFSMSYRNFKNNK